tara:strand:- start:913 stop:1554 length:642 start_codon:yes stop_codon:yes gene_type:complete
MSKSENTFEATLLNNATVGKALQTSQKAYDKARKEACKVELEDLKAARELYFFNTVFMIAVFNQGADKKYKIPMNKQICKIMGWVHGNSQQKHVSAVLYSPRLAEVLKTAETVEDVSQILLTLSKSGVKSFNALKNWYGQLDNVPDIPVADFEKSDNDTMAKEIRKNSTQDDIKDLLEKVDQFLENISIFMEETELQKMRSAMLGVVKTIGKE